jgi:hypothetical protein
MQELAWVQELVNVFYPTLTYLNSYMSTSAEWPHALAAPRETVPEPRDLGAWKGTTSPLTFLPPDTTK